MIKLSPKNTKICPVCARSANFDVDFKGYGVNVKMKKKTTQTVSVVNYTHKSRSSKITSLF